ncbi:hypothetical protein SYNPS1DRAFT_21045 [Syncephalis pseudoplumigaleata]|uniref:Uncharacterized protein n=1 Tax=Syncephalis pseudoplumigaleata TaxID=1712513 RepID=A0A4P9Z6W2_9FUNG|nr:hypothetical protein SYNPS1DRAFT_21045 [Syncephalis pseudoplumigaleata]|eukprot:RKP27420.1 hypothetical protein SYNPS1DRAFT_21045 [Syncephalis pseudoplumigaleata]
MYTPPSCAVRVIITGIFFEINLIGLDIILATKAYVLNQKYLYQRDTRTEPSLRGWMGLRRLIPSQYMSRLVIINVQQSGALTIYHGLLQSDILQLVVSTISVITLILIYTLVTVPGGIVIFYPVVLAHAVAGFFVVESLKSGVRTRRHIYRKNLEEQMLVTRSFYLSREQAADLRKQLAENNLAWSSSSRHQAGVLYHGSKSRIPKWNQRFPMSMFRRRRKRRTFPYIFVISLVQALAGFGEALLAILYFMYTPPNCAVRAILTGILFEISTIGLEAILATKAYLLNQKYLYQRDTRTESSSRGWMRLRRLIPSQYIGRLIIIVGATLLIVKHGFAIAMFSTYKGLSYLLRGGCGAVYFPYFYLVVIVMDGTVSFFFGMMFLMALRAHIHRIKQNVQQSGVLAIYHGLLQSDILQLIVSSVSAITLILIYSLVALPGDLVLFYPIALAHAVAGFFVVESLKSGVRTRRHIYRKNLEEQMVTLYI